MSLDLDNHLLETEDGLVTTLLGQLVLHVVLGAVASVTSTVLGLVGNVGRGLVPEGLRTRLKTLLGVHAGRGALALVLDGEVGGAGRITRVTRMGSLSGVAGGLVELVAIEGLLLVVLLLDLVAELVARHVGHIVPGIVVGRLVDLVELVLGRVDAVGGLLGGVTGDVAEEDGGILDWAVSV